MTSDHGRPVEQRRPGDQGSQSGRRLGSRESLERHREDGRRSAEWQRNSNEIDALRMQNPQSNGEATSFPYQTVVDWLTSKPIALSEQHIVDTKNFMTAQESNKETFNELSRRESSIQYWIKSHKKSFEAINIEESSYDKMVKDLADKTTKIKDILSIDAQLPSRSASLMNRPLDNSKVLKEAIMEYKNSFSNMLDVAYKLHRFSNGKRPLALEAQVLSPEQIKSDVKGIEQMRARAQQLRNEQDEQLQEQRRKDQEIREEDTNQ